MNVGEVAGQTVPHCHIARADEVFERVQRQPA